MNEVEIYLDFLNQEIQKLAISLSLNCYSSNSAHDDNEIGVNTLYLNFDRKLSEMEKELFDNLLNIWEFELYVFEEYDLKVRLNKIVKVKKEIPNHSYSYTHNNLMAELRSKALNNLIND